MFRFNFDLEDGVEADDLDFAALDISDKGGVDDDKPTGSKSTPVDQPLAPFDEIPISQLLDALPPVISYSPLSIPLSTEQKQPVTLPRRDLFDARFQLVSEGGRDETVLQYFDTPSDLIPGIYEGGFKTWECSLDLVDYLESSGGVFTSALLAGKRMLEVGCGTAVPSMYLLQKILSLPVDVDSPTPETQIHLQDYNASVLELVTLPNLLLTWYASPAASSHRGSTSQTSNGDSQPFNLMEPSELTITPELKSAFVSSLRERNIALRFFSGSWETFDFGRAGVAAYDIVLTSETIYRTENLPPLIKLLRSACIGVGEPLQEIQRRYLCLVAAKMLYFGVGGGIPDFVEAVEGPDGLGRVETVWKCTMGVARRLLSVTWSCR
ncbi:hypothetical protein AX17_004058 [Amanita inopinata Kibby_2008]|nr:hypothetical protein AX17_004058 [Amanita inopinata Kibby_2008]